MSLRPFSHRNLLAVAALIGLALAPRTGSAQGVSADTNLCVMNVPDHMTCIVTEETKPENKQTPARCHVVECDASGKNCTSPPALPNGWKQPLAAEQCQQIRQVLGPLPPVESLTPSAKEKPRG